MGEVEGVSSATGELAKALAAAQKKIKAPKKTRHVDYEYKGQRTKYSYADLADCVEAIKPLADHGLSVTQTTGFHEPLGFVLITRLSHSSGEFIDSYYPLPSPASLKPQAFGSAMTYARRYSLSAIVGFASEDDDDGQAAQEADSKPAHAARRSPPARPKRNTQAPARKPTAVSPDFLKQLVATARKAGWTNEQMKSLIKVETGAAAAKDMSHADFQKVLDIVKRYNPEEYLAIASDHPPEE